MALPVNEDPRSIRPSGSARLFAGFDLGSTGIKVLVIDDSGKEVLSRQLPTPWRVGADGASELHAEDLMAAIEALIGMVVERLGRVRIEAVALAGMGESGMLVDPVGRAVVPAFAWFDPRGAEQAAGFPEAVRSQFAGRTGLPLGAQVTVAKLAFLRDRGVDLRGLRWLNLPEYVAAALGGDIALEYSLTSRTGLLDQDTGAVWPAMLDTLGVAAGFLPSLRDAGGDWGMVDGRYGASFAGARLTVAGHDHLVAAEAGGALDPESYHVSLGTAEVLLRVIDAPLGFEARSRLTDCLINEVRHVAPGKHILVAGLKTGLLLRRALAVAGVTGRAALNALDQAVMAAPYEGAMPPGSVEVSGVRNDDGALRLTVRADGASPADVFGAILRHSNDEISRLIAAIDREIPPATRSTLTGGWTGLAAVRRARARVLPALGFSEREQETAYGAALVAARLAGNPAVRHHEEK